MIRAEVVFAVVSGLLINEAGEWCPWLARKLARWSARCRYGDQPRRAEIRAEELAALVNARPGKLFKLLTALGFAVAAAPVPLVRAIGRRRSAEPPAVTRLDFMFGVLRALSPLVPFLFVLGSPPRTTPQLVVFIMATAASLAATCLQVNELRKMRRRRRRVRSGS
jgi:hypothetical protein